MLGAPHGQYYSAIYCTIFIPDQDWIFLQELHAARQGQSAAQGGEIHESDVGVEGAVLLRLYETGEEEKEPQRLASR